MNAERIFRRVYTKTGYMPQYLKAKPKKDDGATERSKRIALARTFFILLAREQGFTYKMIGTMLNRSHATVMHLKKKYENEWIVQAWQNNI